MATGVLNLATGAPVRTDSVFHIGSITKLFVATAVMRLVEDGRLDLDAPVRDVLPELVLGDPVTASRVSLRHLLTHTSGIDGDVFIDTGRGDDCVERYVAALAEVAQNTPLGATWSYCNAGFSLVGRVLERVTGKVWDEAVQELVCKPLGLADTVTLPEDVLLRSAAVGHMLDDAGRLVPVRQWNLTRSIGPAGLISSTAADLLAFARTHLDGELLTAESLAQMQAPQARVDAKFWISDTWGLGWARPVWDGHQLVGHDGSTIGQQAHLMLLPSAGLAVALLTNRRTPHLYEDLVGEVFSELAGVHMPAQPSPPSPPLALLPTEHQGRYERAGQRIEILVRDGSAVLRVTATGKLAEYIQDPVEELPMRALAPDVYLVPLTGTSNWIAVTFYRLVDGGRYLHFCGRASALTE